MLPKPISRRRSCNGLQICLLGFLLGFSTSAAAQKCAQTPDGRVCKVQQPIVSGALVPPDLQKQLGLVTVNGGCSGTLLNRYWVLTARHCVQVNSQVLLSPPLLAPALTTVTATWMPGRVGLASRIDDFTGGTADIALIYLGAADLGPVDTQRIYASVKPGTTILTGRLTTSDTVTQYGQGISTYASGVFGGVPAAIPASGNRVYRSAVFNPSAITATGYNLAVNSAGQVGEGGDSGGPTVVTVNGVGAGIAGVQSTCVPTGYVTNAPSSSWQWATGVSSCAYVSTEPYWTPLLTDVREIPGCHSGSACAIPVIIMAAMRTKP